MIGVILGILGFGVLLIIFGGLRIVREWEEGLIFTFGKLTGQRPSGLTWIVPFIQQITRVDLRVRTLDECF
jgi:regulator of protease activity HflC (stomatin/prohibitin superfamily)